MKNYILIISLFLVAALGVGFILYKIGSKSSKQEIQEQPFQKEFPEPPMNRGFNEGTRGMGNSKGNCLSDDCLMVSDLEYPAGELPEAVVTSLNKALDDEYKAFATYEAVISELGSVRPFIMILRAEEQHISSLKSIFDKYGVEIPENQYLGNVQAPGTINEACTIGVQAEIDNAALYKDELLPTVENYEDITRVFTNLMNASETKHLPAFEKCAN